MSRTLTAADRSALIRLASTLPAGSPERKAILAGLGKKANAGPSGTLDLRSLGPKGLLQHAVDIVKRTRPFEIDDDNAPVRGLKTTVYPNASDPVVSAGYGVYTVHFSDSTVGEDGDDYALTVDFQFGKNGIEWSMGDDY
jgi:hypothetical protein